MKLSLFTITFLISITSFSQCTFTLEEILRFESMSNSQIETYTLEKGMSKFGDDFYVCDDNHDILMINNGEDDEYGPIILMYTYSTSNKTNYLSFKKHVENVTELQKEQETAGVKYYSYLYEKYEDGICEVLFNSGINELGEWKGTIYISIIK